MDHLVGIGRVVSTMRDNLGLSHGKAEDVSTWPDQMVKGLLNMTAQGKTPTMKGIRRTTQVTRNSVVRSPRDMIQRLVPIQDLMLAQVTEEYHPPDADYWEEIMPQFDLDDAVAEGDLLVEEVMCNIIEPDLIDDRDQDLEKIRPIAFPDSDGAFLLKGNVQDKDDVCQIYDGTCSNAQGCCHDVELL